MKRWIVLFSMMTLLSPIEFRRIRTPGFIPTFPSVIDSSGVVELKGKRIHFGDLCQGYRLVSEGDKYALISPDEVVEFFVEVDAIPESEQEVCGIFFLIAPPVGYDRLKYAQNFIENNNVEAIIGVLSDTFGEEAREIDPNNVERLIKVANKFGLENLRIYFRSAKALDLSLKEALFDLLDLSPSPPVAFARIRNIFRTVPPGPGTYAEGDILSFDPVQRDDLKKEIELCIFGFSDFFQSLQEKLDVNESFIYDPLLQILIDSVTTGIRSLCGSLRWLCWEKGKIAVKHLSSSIMDLRWIEAILRQYRSGGFELSYEVLEQEGNYYRKWRAEGKGLKFEVDFQWNGDYRFSKIAFRLVCDKFYHFRLDKPGNAIFTMDINGPHLHDVLDSLIEKLGVREEIKTRWRWDTHHYPLKEFDKFIRNWASPVPIRDILYRFLQLLLPLPPSQSVIYILDIKIAMYLESEVCTAV